MRAVSSRIVAIVLTALLAVSGILVTPMAASAVLPDWPDRSIGGSVIDGSGNPVTSGTVTLASSSDTATILDTVSIDENGTFTFEGVAPDYYRVSVSSSGFETSDVDIDSTDSSHVGLSVQLVPLPCSTGCTYSGTIYDTESQPVAFGNVDFYSTADLEQIAVRGSIVDGTWSVPGLAAGDYVIRFSAWGYQDLIYGDQSSGVIEDLDGGTVVTVSGDSGFDVTLTKTPTTTISGIARTATSDTPTTSVTLERFIDDAWYTVGTTSTFYGSYSFTDIVSGTYRVTADSSTYKIAKKTFTVATSPVTVPVIVLAAAPLRTVTVGTHLANTTTTVQGLTISAYLLVDERWSLVQTSTTGSFEVRDNATYRFIVSDPSNVYASISASNSDADSDEYVVTGDPTYRFANYPTFTLNGTGLDFEVPLYPLGKTTGYVTYFGTPIEGATVTFVADGQVVETQTAADGSFTVYLPEGTFDATVTAFGYDDLVVGGVVSWGYNGQPDSFTLSLLHKTLTDGELGTMVVPTWSISQTPSEVSVSTEDTAMDPDDAVRTVSWTRDGVPLDETGDSVAITSADAGFQYTAVITYSDSDYLPAGQALALEVDGLPVPEGSVQISEGDDDYWVAELPSNWPEADYSYQWLLNGEPVDGATNNSFAVNESQRGYYLSVHVTATPEGYTHFDETSALIYLPYKNIAPIVEPSFTKSGDVLTGDTGVWPDGTDISSGWIGDGFSDSGTEHTIQADDYGQTLTFRVVATSVGKQRVFDISVPIAYRGLITSEPASIAVGEGELTAITDQWGPDPVNLTYTWTRDGELVGDSATYALSELDGGRDIDLTVTGTKVGYTAVNRTASVFIPGRTLETTPAPVVLDEDGVYVGAWLYPSMGGWSENPSFDYTWKVDGTIVGHDFYYNPVITDFGHNVTVTATGTAPGFNRHSETSESFALPLLDRNVGGFSIQPELPFADDESDSLVAEIGQELTLNLGHQYDGWSTIAWYRDDSTEVLATGNSFTVTAADLGSTIRAVVTGAAGDGYLAFASSASIDLYGPATDSSEVELSVAGDAIIGSALTAHSTGWPEGTVVRYQWRLDCCETVVGSELAITRDMLGSEYRLYAYGKQPGHTETRVRLSWTDIDRGTLTLVEPTTFSSERAPGETITATPGTYSDDIGEAYVYSEWLIGSHVVGDGLSYEIQPEDRGTQLTLRTWVYYVDGYDDATFDATVSIPLGTIAAGTPTVSGLSSLGAVLTATTGTWASDVTLSTRWLRNGVVIPGDTGLTHTIVAADQGGNITFEVAASAQYSAGTTVSVSTAIPAAAVAVATVTVEKIVTVTVTIYSFTATPAPTISGKAAVGSKLTVKTAAWKPSGVALAYQWYANGKVIAGETGKTLKLVKSVSGKKITVRVTGTKAGYATATVTSKATGKVKKK